MCGEVSMRFEGIVLYGNIKVGTDELGNEIYDDKLITKGKGKITPWTAEDVIKLSREVTETHEKIITTISLEDCMKAERVEYLNKMYDIVAVTDYTRWRVLRVRRYGN